jgi:putative transposase
MMKAYKFRIEVSEAIEQKFEATIDICRELYNSALQERNDAYKWQHKSINYTHQQNQLPDIKKDRTDLKAVHSQVLQDALHRVESAFDHFFRRVREGYHNPGYPKYKNKSRYNSITYPQGGWTLNGDKLRLSKIGTMRVRISQPIIGKIKTVTIKREVGKWYVSFACEIDANTLPATAKAIAIDVNLENFYTDHNGKKVDNPRHLRKSEKKLRKLQRQASRKKKKSNNWKKAQRKVAKQHTKIKNQRRDFTHKQSRKLVNKYDIIFYENLNIAGMLKNPKLAKSISDVAWGMFFDQLEYKAEYAGKLAKNVNPHNTSQLCSACNKKVPKGLSVRWHKCIYCGLELNRDQNSALNILARGIELLQAEGLSVSAPGGLALARLLNGEPWDIPSHLLPSSLASQTVASS